MGRKLTKEEFECRVREVSNDSIDVSQFGFEGTQKDGLCICKICGHKWRAKAYSILAGHGCRNCYDRRSSSIKTKSLKEIQDKIDKSGSNCEIIGDYIDTKHKCLAKCRTCGYTWKVLANSLINGHGCPRCTKNIRYTNETWIKEAQSIHGNKYVYSKVNYINNTTKVCIICPIHGEFWQEPSVHLRGCGCPHCSKNSRMTIETFIEKSIIVHGNKYDYSKVNYVNGRTKVCIICPEHGEFWQRPQDHLRGQGCPKCPNRNGKRGTKEEFIKRARELYGDKYDYSRVEYINCDTKVCIICPEHGEFWQTPYNHLHSQGCPKCTFQRRGKLQTYDTAKFTQKAVEIHGDKYSYSRVNYVSYDTKVCIICPIHGEFWQTPSSHLQGIGCPKCGNIMSKPEDEIIALLTPLECEQRKKFLGKKEIDIYIPSLKLGIEYNGLRWHSEEFGKDKNYHLNKLEECDKQGIKLIQIFEDEWLNKRNICESQIKRLCDIKDGFKEVSLKDCEIKFIDNKETVDNFLEINDINGIAPFDLAIGAYYGNMLIAIATLEKKEKECWKLQRLCLDIELNCDGIEQKMLDFFKEKYEPKRIVLIKDRRWTIDPYDNLYSKIGFEFKSFTVPKCTYYNLTSKQNIRFKEIPSNLGKEEKFTKIWNCGEIIYEYSSFNNVK